MIRLKDTKQDDLTPVSTELMEHVNKVVTQYNEGAILATEALFNIVNGYLQKQDEVLAEDMVIQREMQNMRES